MSNALKFKSLNLPKQQGERSRLKVVAGPDIGAVFVIVGNRATIGRGEDNDCVLTDLKSSRRHAEILQNGTSWLLKDAGSSNGILHNAKAVKSSPLRSGDSITLGETTLEFVMVEAGTMAIVADPKSIEQLRGEQAALEAQIKKVRALGQIGTAKPAGAGQKAASGGPKILLLALGGAAAYLFLTPTPPPPKRPNRTTASIPVVSVDPTAPTPQLDPTVAKTAEQFFKQGFREYRVGNYLRALQHFETVLQVAPGHQLAILYKENCNKAIDAEVKGHLDLGKKDMAAGKLKEARGHFEAVERLQHRQPDSAAMKEAKEQLDKVNKELTNPMTGEAG